MGRREDMSFNVKCPICGKAGRVEASEAENPNWGRQYEIDLVPDGFIYAVEGDSPQSVVISCEDHPTLKAN